ncbi:MAG: hypothetical protein CVU39_22850 [Chloroflexi bacterium HGW-Chloroflexi-10]|nr:MAG: hypothetical protein CVU39_22850 [Chloroflexi bacterium HGW-Chloroflexi-10]
MDYSHTLVLACATVIEEMLPIIPPGMQHQVFDFGLHVNPQKLRETLQESISQVADDIDTIILGYGLCSQAVIGIKSERCKLVVPRVDDCIAIFLGSLSSYKQQAASEPGTYYLTKGWIEVGDTPFSEHERTIERFGEEKALRILKIMLANYKRLALINTGQYEMDRYRDYARTTAEKFDLRYEEVKGSNDLVKKMLLGDWDEEFVVVGPGEPIAYNHFYPSDPA